MRRAWPRTGERGFVLVNALILVAVMSAISLGVMRETARSIDRTAAARSGAQTAALASAGFALAARLLREDLADSAADHAAEPWALRGYRTDAGDGIVTVGVADAQARFNLNLLIAPDVGPVRDAFLRLAASAGLPAEAAGRLLDHYTARTAPAGTAEPGRGGGAQFIDGDLSMLAEIAALPGLSLEAAERLVPVATLLPRERRVNANTAPREVLAAVLGIDDGARLSDFMARRRETPFENLAEVQGALVATVGPAAGEHPGLALLDTASAWFEVDVAVEIGDARAAWRALVHRDPDTGDVRRVATYPVEP